MSDVVSLASSIKRIAWAFGCAKKNTPEESQLYRLLLEKIALLERGKGESLMGDLGPANNRSLEVTQELAALLYVEEPGSIDPVMPAFLAGLRNDPCDPPMSLVVWQSGSLAAELMQLGGQQ